MDVNKGPSIEAEKNPASRTVFLADLSMTRRSIHVDEAELTGAQLGAIAGFRRDDLPVILQIMGEGIVEELRLDESAKISLKDPPTFVVATADKLFRLEIDGNVIPWPAPNISGSALRALADRDETYEVVLDLHDGADRVIGGDDVASLREGGVERFTTRPEPKIVTVFYNHEKRDIARGTYTTEQLLALFGVSAGYVLDLIDEDGQFIELKAGEKIKVKKGMQFVSHAPTGSSA